MWLKRIVGISMIVTLIGMNAIILIGFFSPSKNSPDFSLSQATATATPPSVTLKADPAEVATGLFSVLSWQTSGQVDSCTASGDWSGAKPATGGESTGKLATDGVKTYVLTCKNSSGSREARATVTIKAGAVAVVPSSSGGTKTGTTTTQATVYCGGASPCYGPREIASHGSAGNCWGWNLDRVLNITGFDAGFHKGQSAVSSIEVSSICGKNIAPALAGSIGANEAPGHAHSNAAKVNAERNMMSYFVGYYDASKP